MKKKMSIRIAIDACMTVLLLALMGRQISGEFAHEWLGALMFVLWIVHHLFNVRWYGNLGKGRYTPYRIVQTIINGLLLIAMLVTMISAVVLSREAFSFLSINGGIAMARGLHIAGAFWSFVLMAAHLGLHWQMILGMARKRFGPCGPKARWLIRAAGALIALYGLSAFIRHQFLIYLSLSSSFVFFDHTQPAVLFFVDHAAIIGMFVFLAHYGSKALSRRK